MAPARSILRALLVLVVFLVAAELTTRRWIQTPATTVSDPRFGIRPEPHQTYISHTEGYSVRRTNAFGFFDDDTLPVRPRERVLLLGDSFAEGLQMRQDQTFAAVVERLLPGVEVVNAAQSGRFPVYYAAALPEFQRVFRPDVVVVQLNDGDLDELDIPARTDETLAELRECRRLAAGADPDRPVARRERGFMRGLLHEFVLLKFVWDRVELLRIQERIRWTRKWHGTEMSYWERTGEVPTRAPALLDSLCEVMKGVNPRLVLVYMPHVTYFDTPIHLLYPKRAEFFRAFAARHGVPLVDPTDSLFAEYRRTGQPLHGFPNSSPGVGHMNARGHALIGRLLAATLERLP